jgi:hypothetical protein
MEVLCMHITTVYVWPVLIVLVLETQGRASQAIPWGSTS